MYTHAAKSQVVQTAWVVITLLHAKYPHKERIKRAVKVIMDRQLADGSWAQEQIEGIFNRYVFDAKGRRLLEVPHLDTVC